MVMCLIPLSTQFIMPPSFTETVYIVWFPSVFPISVSEFILKVKCISVLGHSVPWLSHSWTYCPKMSAGIMSLTAAFYYILLELPITSFRLLADLMMWSFPSVFRCDPSYHCSFTLCFAFGLALIMHINALHVLHVLSLI